MNDAVRRLTIGLFVLTLAGCASRPPDPAAPTPLEPGSVETRTTRSVEVPRPLVRAVAGIRVRAVGDVMLGTDFPSDRLPPAEHPGILAPVAHLLRDADVTFANLEGVLMDGGEPEKVCSDPSLCYLFRTPTRFGTQLAKAGVDVVSLANNHARDFGELGRDASMTTLDQLGILHSGRVGDVARWEHRGTLISLVAFAPNPGSYDLNDLETAASLVADEVRRSDIVLVSFHGGAEGADAVHVPRGMETYYGEQRGDLRLFARTVIDSGADLVIGHGPHVPRGLELYRGRLIAYSLGNFATHWGISVAGIKGLAPILEVSLAGDGRFVEGRIISAIQRRPEGVFPDPEHRAARLMAELSAEGFPDSPLRIGIEGELSVDR